MSEHKQRLNTVDFTGRWYREFMTWLGQNGYRSTSYGDPPAVGDLYVRHDVDLSVERASEMARLEADLGVTATYFFQLTSTLYNPLERDTRSQIRHIASLGHDVGLHFSTHQYWPKQSPPKERELVDRVTEELTTLETVTRTPVEVVSFHIPPQWVLDRPFEAFTSAYAPTYFSEIGYVSDSNHRWREGPPFEPDDPLPDALQVLTHPGLWQGTATFRECVTDAVLESCRATNRQAHREYLEGVYSR